MNCNDMEVWLNQKNHANMKDNRFDTENYNIEENQKLRVPQREGFISIRNHYGSDTASREIGIILPVGCGKSGLIAISPYATSVLTN